MTKKNSRGGNAQTIGVIIFGIVLVIIVLGGIHKLKGTGGFKFTLPTLYAPGGFAGGGVYKQMNTSQECGVTIISTKENDIVHVPFVISGVVDGCNWKPFERLVGVATIYDAKKKKIGSIPLQIFSADTKLPAPFSGMFTEYIAPGKVTIKITNAPVTGQRMRTITIPVVVQ
jgi:hypothetical protein